MNEPEMTFENAASMGLSEDEWKLILKRLARTPNLCELDFLGNVVRTLLV